MISQDLELPLPLDELRAILTNNGVRKAYVFGSYARGEATGSSDLDLLVELEPDRTYMDLGMINYELEEKYSVSTDIATKLNKHFAPYITPDLVEIL